MPNAVLSTPLARFAPVPSPRPARLTRTPRSRAPPPRGFAFEHAEDLSAEDVKTDVAVGMGGHTRTGGDDVMDEARVVDPYGLIRDVMSSPADTLTPGLEMDDPVVRQSLERHHGLPVVSLETGVVIGVISRSDLEALRGETAARTVGEVMSSPPVCVRPRAHIAECAGMMLQHKVHRLPVVDDRDVPIGIATRQDVFEPLITKRNDVLVDQQNRRYARGDEIPNRDRATGEKEGNSEGRDTERNAEGDSSRFSVVSASSDDDVYARKREPRRRRRARARRTSASPHRIRVAAKPFTKPFAARRDAPLTALSDFPHGNPAGCDEASASEEALRDEEAQAERRARKIAEGFQQEDDRWALDVDIDGV